MKLKTTILLSFLLFPVLSYGEDVHSTHTPTKGVEALSPGLRNLLSEEMIAVQSGMQSIIPEYVSGNWEAVEKTAKKIKDSYILKQRLTKTQKEELHTLPHGFIEQDKKFHYLAGMLENAAKHRKSELMNFYFSMMNESCVDCHSSYATSRFPSLKLMDKLEHAH